MHTIVGIKDLRLELEKYVTQVWERGKSFRHAEILTHFHDHPL